MISPPRLFLLTFACAMTWVLASTPTQTQAIAGQAEGDPQRGEQLFNKRCGGCHSLDQSKEGPRLRDVYGRKAGSVANFTYSDAMKQQNFTWDAAQLDRWLQGPDLLVPNTYMDFAVQLSGERRDIIAFLKLSSGR